jgi:hypothetical protein
MNNCSIEHKKAKDQPQKQQRMLAVIHNYKLSHKYENFTCHPDGAKPGEGKKL